MDLLLWCWDTPPSPLKFLPAAEVDCLPDNALRDSVNIGLLIATIKRARTPLYSTLYIAVIPIFYVHGVAPSSEVHIRVSFRLGWDGNFSQFPKHRPLTLYGRR